MRRVVCVCVCLSTFAGSTTTVWATDLALPPLRLPPSPPPTEVFAYRWSGCHAGANAGVAWSRQQQAWSQVGNAAAPAQPVPPPVVKPPPVVAQPVPPPVKNPPPNNGGWKPPPKPPNKPPICERPDKGWWQAGKPYHGKDKDHKWPDYGDHKPGHDADHDWPKVGSKDGYNKHADKDWPWQQNDHDKYSYGKHDNDKYDKQDHDKDGGWSQLHSNGYSDRYAWLKHDRDDQDKQGGWGWKPLASYAKYEKDDKKDKDDNYGWQKHDDKHDHDGYAWQPKPWPPKNPPPNNGGGQPPKPNPPRVNVPPSSRRSSTLSLSRLPSHLIAVSLRALPRGQHGAPWRRPSATGKRCSCGGLSDRRCAPPAPRFPAAPSAPFRAPLRNPRASRYSCPAGTFRLGPEKRPRFLS